MTFDALCPPPLAGLTGSSRRTRRLRLAALAASAALLAACGGGGGGDAPAPAPAPSPTPAPSPPPAGGSFTISGAVTFDSVPRNSTGVGLNYGGVTQKPIRGATAQLLDASNNVLATTTTSDTGAYSFTLGSAQSIKVRVLAEIKRTGSASGDRDFTVRDNTASNGLYALDSTAFTPSAAATTLNLNAASGWGGSSYTATRSAAPFAILDVVYAAQAKVATAATVTLPPLQLYWSPNNQPTSPFNAATGAIGTSFFTTNGSTRSLYLLGAANTDTDEYDSHVVAHEFGHYLQSAISRDDSPGGAHSTGDKLDMRLAFSEGWGNAWSGMALNDAVYSDSVGANQASGFFFNLGTAAPSNNTGWYSERSSQYLLWTAHQTSTIGFTPIYNALRGLTTVPAFTTLHSFVDQLKTAAPSAATAITALWATQSIVANDAYGAGETNNGGITSTLPIYNDYGSTPNVTRNYCVTTAADSASDGNKLGRYVYVRFTLSGSRTITATRSGGTFGGTSDPDLILVKSDGSRALADDSTANTQALATTLPAGTHVLGLEDYNLTSPSTSCFNLTVN